MNISVLFFSFVQNRLNIGKDKNTAESIFIQYQFIPTNTD